MNLSARTKQLLNIMLKEKGTVSVQKLADKMGISKRTVQRELEYIDSSLKGFDVKFRSKTGSGVWLEGSSEEKERLLSYLKNGDSYDVSNREDRRKRLILEILKNKGLQKLYYYSSKFKVSEATISGDLDAVEKWLEKNNLHIVRKPGSGVIVRGSEESFRRAIRAFIRENIDTRVIKEEYEGKSGFDVRLKGLFDSRMGKILDESILKRVIDLLAELNDERIAGLTESSFVGLVIHVTIAVNRIIKGEIIENDTSWAENMANDKDYETAEKISRELEKEFAIDIPPVETTYICLHLKGAKHEKISMGALKTVETESPVMQQLINEMINVFDRKNALLLKQDDEFIQGLLAHLQPTFIRIMHNMSIANPMLESIKSDYPDIFEKCIKVSEVLEGFLGKPVPEEETGFLTVHFGAAVVRLEEKAESLRQVNIGVICSSGIGVSRLMCTKLKKIFKDRAAITAYGKKDIEKAKNPKTDFYITSIAIEPQEIPVIYVSPLLTDRDISEIRKLVYTYERTPEKQEENTTFSYQLDKINILAQQINTVIKSMEFFRVNNSITFDELLIAIGEKLSPYRGRGEIIQADIRKREKIATQVFAEFGFALFHAKTKGVIKPSFSVCMTKDLGSFTDPYFKGIKIVFIMLLPIDDNITINTDMLGYISSMIIDDENFLKTVMRGNKQEIREMLSAHLKRYFNRFLTRF